MLNRYRIETEDSINYCITWVLAHYILLTIGLNLESPKRRGAITNGPWTREMIAVQSRSLQRPAAGPAGSSPGNMLCMNSDIHPKGDSKAKVKG